MTVFFQIVTMLVFYSKCVEHNFPSVAGVYVKKRNIVNQMGTEQKKTPYEEHHCNLFTSIWVPTSSREHTSLIKNNFILTNWPTQFDDLRYINSSILNLKLIII